MTTIPPETQADDEPAASAVEFTYEVAISYAGEDREMAKSIADGLKAEGVPVFYDQFERSKLWGKNLYQYLADVYSTKARFCLLL
ncbi:MAG: TIR domain-containing protein, partial [Acidobacteriota bacterium]